MAHTSNKKGPDFTPGLFLLHMLSIFTVLCTDDDRSGIKKALFTGLFIIATRQRITYCGAAIGLSDCTNTGTLP